MRNYLIDLSLKRRFSRDGGEYGWLSIEMGAVTVTGRLTNEMLLDLVREGVAIVDQVAINGGVINEKTVALPYFDGEQRRPYWYEENEE